MRIVFISLITLLVTTHFACAQNNANAQSANAPEKTIILQPTSAATSTDNITNTTTKKTEAPSLSKTLDSVIKNPSSLVSPEKIKDAIGSVLMNNKASSLMFDDEENSNINRAVDSFKSSQPYVPDDSFDSKQLTEEEKKRAAQKAEEEERKKLENEKSYAHLASILYLNEKNWVVWINQRKLLSSANKPENELYIKSIDKDRVSCVWRMSLSKWKILSGKFSAELAPKINSNNQVEMEFSLRPNQAYSLVSNKIVEGKANIGDLATNKLASSADTQNDKGTIAAKSLASAAIAKVSDFATSSTTPSNNTQNSSVASPTTAATGAEKKN